MANIFFTNCTEQFMNRKLKIIGKGLYSPNWTDVTVLESVHLSTNLFSQIYVSV